MQNRTEQNRSPVAGFIDIIQTKSPMTSKLLFWIVAHNHQTFTVCKSVAYAERARVWEYKKPTED